MILDIERTSYRTGGICGTRFIATKESKQMMIIEKMIESAAKDIVYTNYFSGVTRNYLGLVSRLEWI